VVSRLQERAGDLEEWAAFLRTLAEERWVIPATKEWETVARLDPLDWLPVVRGKDDEPAEFAPLPESF
jgi:hypothetical protein